MEPLTLALAALAATCAGDATACVLNAPASSEARTHTLALTDPGAWPGFVAATFAARDQPDRRPRTFTYAAGRLRGDAYRLPTDQFGTQLDPPAHWAPEYAAIDELPPTFAVRPLVVISIVPQVKKDFNYALQVVGHPEVGAAPRPHPGGQRRDRALRLVEALAGPGAAPTLTRVPGRRRSTR